MIYPLSFHFTNISVGVISVWNIIDKAQDEEDLIDKCEAEEEISDAGDNGKPITDGILGY